MVTKTKTKAKKFKARTLKKSTTHPIIRTQSTRDSLMLNTRDDLRMRGKSWHEMDLMPTSSPAA